MPARRMRAACLLLVASLAACARPAPPPQTASQEPSPAACRVGPDGRPAVALQTVDRGIGGTGAPPTQVADRGIGGTGIIAVITGFASVCLAGQEVAVAPDVKVSVSEQAASVDALRAGQVVVIDAAGTRPSLQARSIAIRYEVSGPVEAVNGDQLVVAGQPVAVSSTTWGERPARGDWVSVSGLRRPDGVIAATRIDRRSPGEVIVHGTLVYDHGELHIGAMPIQPSPSLSPLVGQNVTAIGTLIAAGLVPEQVTPDLLASNPAALFAPTVGFFYIETFAVWEEGRVRFGQGFRAEAPGLPRAPSGPAVLELQRSGNGLRALGAVPSGSPSGRFGPGRSEAAPISGRQFEPAPVPNRGFGSGSGGGRFFGQGSVGANGRGRNAGQEDRNNFDAGQSGQFGGPSGGPSGQFGGSPGGPPGQSGGPGPGGGRGR